MHIGSLLYFSLFLAFVLHPAIALRAQRASRKSLAHLKQVLNDDFARLISTRQNDQVDPFADLRSNPKARRNKVKDELSINDPEDYFQGDVDLSEQQVLQIEKVFTEGRREKRKIGRVPLYKLWDRTRAISFDFNEAIKYRTREKIRQAMNLWQNNTCIRFDEGGPNVDRLEFFDGGGCSSFVGRIGGTQIVLQTLAWDNMEVEIDGQQLHHPRFTDDVVLTTTKISQAERILSDFDKACGKIGIRLNLTETMFMRNGLVSYAPFTFNGTNISECSNYISVGKSI
uniref:ZnMc domain-containing protein n=1 Tax=Angiostrongylus cantonensis TaxID=6313 RepID=A0A0K0D3M7_ANGCA